MKKLIITGPESSGKTTLFHQLINFYNIKGVHEYAREYIDNLNRVYNYKDILEIAKVQFNNELKIYNCNQNFLISDTDLLTLEIWCEVKYKKCHSFISDNLRKYLPDFYFLCSPDIPWEFDSQRENPHNRFELFNIYENKIKSLGVDYYIIKGDKNIRVNNVKTTINNIINS